MILKSLSDTSKKTFENTFDSYKRIRENLIIYVRELAKLEKLYNLLGDSVFTYGIKIGEHEIKIKSERRRKEYQNFASDITSLIYHIADFKPYIFLEDIGVEALPGIFKDFVNLAFSGNVGNTFQEYFNDLSLNEREEFLDNLKKSLKIRLEDKKGVLTEHKEKKKNTLWWWSKLNEDLRQSFGAKKVGTLADLYPQENRKQLWVKEDGTSMHIYFFEPMYDARQLDVLIGWYKLGLLGWMDTSRATVKEPLDLIVPLDRTYEPFELSEKTIREIIEDYHFRVNHVINLTRKKTLQVLSRAEKMLPFSYTKLTNTLNCLLSILDETQKEMGKNKERELELSKLYYELNNV